MGLLELDDLVRVGEAHFDESRLAQGTAHLRGPVKRRRATRAVATGVGTAGVVGLGAMTAYGIGAIDSPAGPLADASLEQALSREGVQWSGGVEGQQFAWCNWEDLGRVTEPAIYPGSPIQFEHTMSLECDHMVLPGTELLEIRADLHLDSTAQTSTVTYEVTNISGGDFDILAVGTELTWTTDGPIATETGPNGEYTTSVWAAEQPRGRWEIFEPGMLSSASEPFPAGATRRGASTHAVSDYYDIAVTMGVTPESQSWVPDVIAYPESVRVSVYVRVARSELAVADEVTLYTVDVGNVYLDGELMYQAPN